MSGTGQSIGASSGSGAGSQPNKAASSEQQQAQQQLPSSGEAVEMENLSPQPPADASNAPATTATTDDAATVDASDRQPALSATDPTSTSPTSSDAEPSAGPSAKALGKAPATADEEPLTIEPAAASAGTNEELAVDIMLIVTSSNSRHPFRIDQKYLTKRNVNVTGVTEDGKMDPFSITVYTLKELILRDWRNDWEAPPREPTSIRLIYFGKLLDDKLPLSRYNFNAVAKNVVHMTVKPREIVDEEDANKQAKDPSARSERSGCCVIL